MENVEEGKEKQKKKFTVWQKLTKYFREYCNNTSIHGVRYFGEEERTIHERIWWVIAIALSVAFCITLIVDTYQKWERAPVIVTFATTEKPIWQIPFPAVTICPETKTDPEIFNYTKVLGKVARNQTLTEEEKTNFSYMSLICSYKEIIDYEELENADDVETDVIIDFYHNTTNEFKYMFDQMKFMGKLENFEELFVPILTDEGVCYTFNMLDRTDMFTDIVKHYNDYHLSSYNQSGWSLEGGYDKNAGKDVYPRRALYAGAESALEITIIANSSFNDYTCTSGLQGFKVQVHHPAQIPRVRQQYFRVPFHQNVIAAITPKMIETSEEVKIYPPVKRQCYFTSERKLMYFSFYTQQNCQIECKTNFTLDYCECVNFYMPHDNSTLICGAQSMDCIIEAEKDFLSKLITSRLYAQKSHRKGNKEKPVEDICNCLPVCTSIDYSVETSQTDWDWKKTIIEETLLEIKEDSEKMRKMLDGLASGYQASSLSIYFKTNQLIPSQRNELYGSTDFLANFGGLLGLFTGFSILSLVEIVYFLSLRILCNIRLYGRKFWAGVPN